MAIDPFTGIPLPADFPPSTNPCSGTPISLLPLGGALNGSEWIPLVQNSITVKIPLAQVGGGGGGGGGSAVRTEHKTISTANVIPALSFAANGQMFLLIVNGRTFTIADAPQSFSVSGTVVTWLSSTYSLSPGDGVVAVYTH